MAVITLGSPDFNPVPLSGATAPTPGAPVAVVSGAESTAMIGESDPIFTSWDRTTGIQIASSQIDADPADIVPTGLNSPSDGLDVAEGGGQSAYVVLNWNAIATSTFDYYQIRYKRSTSTYYSYMDCKTNNVTIFGLIPNSTYNFGICSVNKQGLASAFSSNINVSTNLDTTAPATVTGVTATAMIQGIVVQWNSNTEVDLASYNVYRNTTNNSGGASLVANVSTNYFVNNGLTAGQIQYYWVKAKDTSGNLSTAFSTVASATPTNVTTNDIVNSAVTSVKTNIAAINPVDGEINPNKVGTLQLDTNAITSGKILDGAITAAKTNIAAINAVSGEINANKVGTTQLDTNAVTESKILASAITNNKIATGAVLEGHIGVGAITTNKIAAGAITANEIAAGAVTASKITSYNFVVSEGTFTNNSPTAGKVAWTGVKVVYNGTEYTITNSNCETTDKYIYWVYQATTLSKSATLPTLGNNDFLVAINNSGTYTLVWNSTKIDGNRITSGTVTATQISAGSITATEIASGTITADKIHASGIDANKINTYNFQLISGTFTDHSPTSVQIAWSSCVVRYNGTSYNITNSNCDSGDVYIYWQPSLPTVFGHTSTLPVATNEYFLVATNGDINNTVGNTVYAWNNTTIDGNRITTGSISATHIAAGSITTNHMTAGSIDADRLVAGSITAGLLAADAIDVGNWNIDTDSIYSGTKLEGNGYTASAGSITINSNGSIHAPNFYIDEDGETSFKATAPVLDGVATKSIQIGDWNMDTTEYVTISTGGVSIASIRNVSVLIYGDTGGWTVGTSAFPLEYNDPSLGISGRYQLYDVGGVTPSINIIRTTSGFFDSAAFDATSYNRGWVTIQYEV